MKRKVISLLMILVLLIGLFPIGNQSVKEAEAAVHETVPDTVIAAADKLYPGQTGMKLFFPDIVNVPASVYTNDPDATEEAKTNGKLLVVYYASTAHAPALTEQGKAPAYGEIHIVESTDNGKTWTGSGTRSSEIPQVVVTPDILAANRENGVHAGDNLEAKMEARDPNFAILEDGTILLTFWTNSLATDKESQTIMLESRDGGKTWEWDSAINIAEACEAADIDLGLSQFHKRGDITVFPGTDEILIPLYGNKVGSDHTAVVAVRAKRNADKTWTFLSSSEICNTDDVTAACQESGQHGTICNGLRHDMNEASFITTGREDGKEVFALVRELGYVYRSVDKGETWEYIARENLPMGNMMNQPGLKLYNDGTEDCIYVTYAIPNTQYGRPTFGKVVKLSQLSSEKDNYGWNDTSAQLIYRSLGNSAEGADPSSVVTTDGRILVVYYDGYGANAYIGGTYVEQSGALPASGYVYNEMTLADCGIYTSKTYDDSDYKSLPKYNMDASLDGIAISGIYEFNDSAQFFIGGSWSGLKMTVSDTEISVVNFSPSYFDSAFTLRGFSVRPSQVSDIDSFYGKELDIRMTFNLSNFVTVSGTEYADLLFGITVEDYTTYYIWRGLPTESMKQYMAARNVTLKNPNLLTMEDFGVDTILRTNTGQIKTSDESLDGKTIHGIFHFEGAGSIWIGALGWKMKLEVFDDDLGFFLNISDLCAGNPTTSIRMSDGLPTANRDLEILMSFKFANKEMMEKDGLHQEVADVTIYFSVNGQEGSGVFYDYPTAYLKPALGLDGESNTYKVITNPDAKDQLLPNALGGTLATDRDVVKMGFDYSGIMERIEAYGENIESYGAVLVAGTKTADEMKTQADTMIAENLTESDYFKRTVGDIEELLASDNYEYYVTITNSGSVENMGKRATAIGYVKTDKNIYYTADCEAEGLQRVNKSVVGLLKSIFTDTYVADYNAATDAKKESTPLAKAIAKYNTANGTEVTADTLINEIIARDKSTEDDRKILSGVHYMIHSLWVGADEYLKGKTISILGDSISTYEGVSNNAEVNATIGGNEATYGTVANAQWGVGLNDTWWMQAINNKQMKLLVNNSWSGSAAGVDTYAEENIDDSGYGSRATQLHTSAGENPDIIVVALGINDIRKQCGTREFTDAVWKSICTDNGDGTYTYNPTGYFIDRYAVMIHKIKTQYPNADIFVCNLFDTNDILVQYMESYIPIYNQGIADVAEYFGATVVDLYNNTGFTKDNIDTYTFDKLHPNALGMDKVTEAFELALREKYAQ